MANVNATIKTAQAATPPLRVKTQQMHGRIRYFESTYLAPATGMPAIADTITWGDLPVGARIIGHLSQLNWGTGTASSTLNLGDGASAARHLAATAITTAGVAIPQAATASGVAGFEVSDGGATPATNNSTLISTIAGAGLAANQSITLRIAYVMD
jgi:hypothetical protein